MTKTQIRVAASVVLLVIGLVTWWGMFSHPAITVSVLGCLVGLFYWGTLA